MVNMATVARTLSRAQARTMDATVRVEEKTGHDFDETTGKYTDTWSTLYEGPAMVRPEPDRMVEVEAGQGQAGIHLFRVVLEGSPDIPREARVTVTDSPDAALIGRVMWVFDYRLDDWGVNRRLTCEEQR